MSNSRRTPPNSGDSLLDEILKNPGVAEILKLHEEADKQIRPTEFALESVRPRIIYSTSDCTPS